MSLWWQIFLHQVLWLTPIVGVPMAFAVRAVTISTTRLTVLIDLGIRHSVSTLRLTWHPRYWVLWTESQWTKFLLASEGDGLGQKAEGKAT